MSIQAAVRGVSIPILADEPVGETVVILAHGAGSHMEHKTLTWLADLVRDSGASVVRFNFLYRALGKSMPDRMPLLIETYRAVIEAVRQDLAPSKLAIGGHSMGGRVASMLEAEGSMADGLLLFGYPLHPPGEFGKLRSSHLPDVAVPTLQINGTADDFCRRDLMDDVAASLHSDLWRMVWIEGADHSYSIKKSSGSTRKHAENQIRAELASFFSALIARS